MHQRGPALVRIGLFSLLLGALLVAVVEPSLAGTPDSPEVQDPTGDVAITGGLADRPDGIPFLEPADFPEIDIVKAYVQATNATVKITLELAGAPSDAASAKYNVTFNITTAGTTTAKSVQRLGTTVTGPTGTTAEKSGNLLNFTILSPLLGVVAGSTLNGMKVATSLAKSTIPNVPIPQDDQTGTDTAGPSTTVFVFNGPSPDDVDDDKIPDACEVQYFNGTSAQNNASKDLDNDTLTIGEECALGTDPTKADSDGDGVDDKKDPFPTDGTKGSTSSSGSQSGSGSKSGSSSGSGSKSGSGSNSKTGTDGDVKNFSDAVEKLKSDAGYLGTSAGGLIAVLILAILALAVRWSL